MKTYLNYLLFTQDRGFVSFESFTKKKTFFNLIKFLKTNRNSLNKYVLTYFLREITLKFLSFFYLIPACILYLSKFKFAVTAPHTIGTYCEELSSIVSINNNKFKLILIEPRSYVDNKYLTEFYFVDQFYKIKSNFLSIMLIPFTYISFIRITGFNNETNLYFQSQFYNFKKKKYKENFLFDHEILFKNHKNLKIDLIPKLSEREKFLEKMNSKKKICILHLRGENNIGIRNSSFRNYKKTILYLIKNNYEIYYFGYKNPNFNEEGFNFYDLSIDHSKKKQIQLISICDLFIGQISGPFHVNLLANTKTLITDCIVFNHLLFSVDYLVLFKKYKKKNKYLSYKEIFQNNLQCIWNEKNLSLHGIEFQDNNEDEIYNALIEILNNENKIDDNIMSYFKKNNIIFPNFNYAIINRTSSYFNRANNLLS